MSDISARPLGKRRAGASHAPEPSWPRRAVRRPLVVAVPVLLTAIGLALVTGCGRSRTAHAPQYEVERTCESDDGAVALTLKVDKRELSAADSFRCVVELKRGEGVAAELPAPADLDKAFAPLIARNRRSLPERIEDGFVVEADEYELEPLVAGACTIKPFAVTYKEGGEERTLETQPIELAVTSLGAADPRAELRDIAGPVLLPRTGTGRWVWLAIGAGVLAAGVLVLVLVRRRRRGGGPPERRRPAHEEALDALRALREKDYIGRGLVMRFYVELSAILRWYIERRFGLRAPEQTTQEFLAEISRDGFFDLRRRTLLSDFLGHCDLVKFAKYGPTNEEIERVFTSATTFIEETKEASATGGV
jgi:LPXTG-motif cell wall-anchored protein